MMIRFVMRKYKYDYSVSNINTNSEQAIVDVDVPESVQHMLQDGYILERVGPVNDVSNTVSNIAAGRVY